MIVGESSKLDPILMSWLLTYSSRGSFGHGVPPQIARNQYDVPLPTVEVLVPPYSRSPERIRAAHCHIALCRLTEILGELLPLVYGLQLRSPRDISKKIRQLRTDLDVWEDSLPDWLRSPLNPSEERIAGLCSLQLAFLAVKLLVGRVELNVRSHSAPFLNKSNRSHPQDVNKSEADLPEARRYFQTECRKGAEEIVQFISSLRKENFKEFWLPCTQPPSSHSSSSSHGKKKLTPTRQRLPSHLNCHPPRPLRLRNNRPRSRPHMPRKRRVLPRHPPPRPRRIRLGRCRHVSRPLRTNPQSPPRRNKHQRLYR